MRFTVRQFSVVLSVACAIAIAVTIGVASSQPAAASGMIMKAAVVHVSATPSKAAAAARTGGCPPCGGGTKVGIRHCDGQDCEKFQDLCLPPNAALAHIGEQGTPEAGHEQDRCIVIPD